MDPSTLPDIPEPLFDAFPPVNTEAWNAQVRADLGDADPESVLVWDSLEGVSPRAFYRAEDRAGLPHLEGVPLADTAEAPANRWRLRQDVMHPDLETARRHVQAALAGGATDIGLAMNVVDHAVHGVPIQRPADLDLLLQDIDLAATPVHCSGGPAALIMWAMLCNIAEARGIALSALAGSTDFDPIAALAHHRMARADRAFDAAADAVRAATDTTPSARLLSIDLRPYHAAGASAVQQLAYALGACSELLVQLRERDCRPEDVAGTLQWIVPMETSYFVAIAKLRALRLLIPQVLAPFAVETTPSAPSIQAVTARRDETIYGRHANVLRGTTEAAAAIIGGCDVLTVRPFSAAAETPNDFAMRLARNTQLILREETHLDHVADPAAGSYYIEMLTDALARPAWSQFQDLEDAGGLLEALQSGSVQTQIATTRKQRMDEVAQRDRVLIGTNHYPDLSENALERDTAAPSAVPLDRGDRSINTDEARSLSALQAQFDDGATLGDVLPAFTGAGTPSFDALPTFRLGAPFEALRRRTEAWAARHDGAPRVILLPMGDPARRSARATFARHVFGVAGYAVDEHVGFDTASAAAQAAADAAADIAVLCSADDAYPTLVPALREALTAQHADPILVVAGAEPHQREALEKAGADAFIHRDRPLLDTLHEFQQRLGIE